MKTTKPRLTMTVTEVAQILGISRGLAYEMARCGKLPCIRFGKRMVVPRAAIERMLGEPVPQDTGTVADGR